MNLEEENTPSLEERIAACPIHQWADINSYLKDAQVPERLWEPFHELVIARGKYPKVISPQQAKLFGAEAVEITHMYEVSPDEGHPLMMMFTQLVGQWLATGAEAN